MDTMSLSDIAAVTRNDNDGWGNGGAWWIIILFLFVFMGGGFWGNRNGDYGQYATAASQQEILFGQHFGQLNDRLTNIGNGICNLGYDVQGSIGRPATASRHSLPIAAARHSAPSTALTQILKRSSQRLKNRSLNSVLPNSRRVLPALKWITVCMA